MDNLLALSTDPAAWAAFATLTVMEVVLGIDNLVFISILANKLPETQRARVQRIGILLALVLRLVLLSTIAWITQLTDPFISLFGKGLSWRDLILIAGGFFLVWKATWEMHHHVAQGNDGAPVKGSPLTLTVWAAISQIVVLDLVFSVDSIITAVGMTEHIPIMFAAVMVTVAVMLLAAKPLSRFIGSNPSIVMLALSFLLVIGFTLIAEGLGTHIPKGYIYAAMAFSTFVECMNLLAKRARSRRAERSS